MRANLAASLCCAAAGCSVPVAVHAKPAGLTCQAVNGAIVRLNLDLAARRFQKEGFPSLPIESMTEHRVVLMHEKTTAFLVTAFIDRDAMSYVAESEDLGSHKRTATRYVCSIGAPFQVAGSG